MRKSLIIKKISCCIIVTFSLISCLAQDKKPIEKKDKNPMKAILHTPTNKLENSYSFYEKLGFKVISKENPLVVTDGKAVIEINPDRFARAGVKMYKKSWAEEIVKLKELTALTKLPNGFLFFDPSGMAVYLIEADSPVEFSIADSSFSSLGNFMGLTLETADIAKSYAIYEALGFTKTMGELSKGFVSVVGADNFNVTMMTPLQCPHLFYNPSLTYFNGKNNSAVIKKIRDLNIPITEEISGFSKENVVDNIIIRDPGGYGFFLFND